MSGRGGRYHMRTSGGKQRREVDDFHQEPRRKRVKQGTAGTQEMLTTKRHILKMIVSNLQPLAIIEDTHFRTFMEALKPTSNCVIPNTATLMRSELFTVYEQKKLELQQCLASAQDIVLTCELWASRAAESYLTVGCHMVDMLGDLHSYVLQTTSFFGDQTAARIQVQLSGITDAWGITEKVHTVVTAGMRDMRDAHSKWVYMPCFADTLNSVFKDVLNSDPVLKDILRKCRDIVRFFNTDTEAEQTLREMQNLLKITQKQLVQSTDGRWLSSLHMLQSIYKQHEAMNVVLIQREMTTFCLRDRDMKEIENAILALLPLEEPTSMMKKEGFETISLILPLLLKLIASLDEQKGQTNRFASSLVSRCQEHFGDINNHILAYYTALDPRFKDIILRDYDENVKAKIIQELRTSQQAASSPASDIETLVSRYVTSDDIPESGNPLAWWRFTGSQKFKGMSRLALKNLGVVSTAVPLERAFSDGDEMFCNRRRCLEPENINMILFLNRNWGLHYEARLWSKRGKCISWSR